MRDGVGHKEYVGDWANDKKDGYGTNYFRNGDEYEGEWFEGKMSGWGRMTYADGSVYEVRQHTYELEVAVLCLIFSQRTLC